MYVRNTYAPYHKCYIPCHVQAITYKCYRETCALQNLGKGGIGHFNSHVHITLITGVFQLEHYGLLALVLNFTLTADNIIKF